MNVKRITCNISAKNIDKAEQFYKDIFELSIKMDLGWIKTFGNHKQMDVQLSIASQGGSETDVPDLSIEVDDLETVISRIKQANINFEYGPQDESWGVRRFYVYDPFGKLINVMQHAT